MFSHLYFVLVFIQMTSARVGVLTCVRNDDCTDGYSCHKGICTKCFKCKLFFRKGSDCVFDFNECGECLIGYESVLITDSSNAIKPCKRVRLKEKLNDFECANDNTCPPGYYCLEQSCVKCFNCSFLNRLSPVGNCPKLSSDCGSCMNGFEEVPVTMDTNLKLCEKQNFTVISDIPKMMAFLEFGVICSFILVIIFMTVAVFIKRPKVKILSKSQCPKLPSAPPLYIMDMPQHIERIEEQESDVTFTIDHKQQAKVFKQPDAPYYYREDEVQGSDPDLENSISILWTPTNSTEPNTEMVRPSGILFNNHTEQIVGISMTDSAQQPNEVSRSPISINELDDNQLGDFSGDDVMSNSLQENNPPN